MSVIVSATNVSKSYGVGELVYPVIRNVNLEMQQGDFVSIQGASGAGKSTFLNILGALILPDEGVVEIAGRDLKDYSEKGRLHEYRKKHIGFIFQNHYLMPDFTALENVMMPLFLKGKNKKEAREISMDYLDKVGLVERANHFPSQLSGGESQRVAVARSLVHEPDLVLADEPTGNLDSENTEKFIELLRNLQEKNKLTVLVVTHEGDLAGIAQKKYYMKDGLLEVV